MSDEVKFKFKLGDRVKYPSVGYVGVVIGRSFSEDEHYSSMQYSVRYDAGRCGYSIPESFLVKEADDSSNKDSSN